MTHIESTFSHVKGYYSGKENTKLTGHGVGMLFREESVLLIPESIEDESEYEWNLSMAR